MGPNNFPPQPAPAPQSENGILLETSLTYFIALEASLGGRTASVTLEVVNYDPAAKVDFLRDVNPVLSQLGCSSGPCHGAKDGKAGFKLSLRGYDPIFDVRSLVDDHAGRRVNLASPDDSLIDRKSTRLNSSHVKRSRMPSSA